MQPPIWTCVLVVTSITAAATGSADAAPGTVGTEAARLVASDGGYRAVIRDLLGWHRTRTDGCVAFVATALRHVGFVVPDERPDGPWSDPARVTFSLDAYLDGEGWARIDDATTLVAGDVVFSTGAPDHVMLFHGWADRDGLVAVVSDNQGHRYRRPLAPEDGSKWAGFGFARRAPADPAPSVDLDDAPVCADATALRRLAGRAFARPASEVTCRAIAGGGGAVALVTAEDPAVELPSAAQLLVLDARGRVIARRALDVFVDGEGGTQLPALLGAADLGHDGRLEVWTAERSSSPEGTMTSATVQAWQQRGRQLVALGEVDGDWLVTAPAPGDQGGEHWEPRPDPARQLTCVATITPTATGLEIARTLQIGDAVPADAWHPDCAPIDHLAAPARVRR